METRSEWNMPEWMEPFRDQFCNTGGNTIEELINRLNNDDHLSKTNMPVFAMAISVESQMGLLRHLKESGLLRGVTNK